MVVKPDEKEVQLCNS